MIELLNDNHTSQLRQIRLESLSEAPTVFGTSLDEYDPVLRFNENDNLFVFGFFISQKLVGIAAIELFNSQKRKHKCVLKAVFVKKAYRSRGVGKALLQYCFDYAKSELKMRKVLTSSVMKNDISIALYKKLSFTEYGVESNSLCYNGAYFDEVLLEKVLT